MTTVLLTVLLACGGWCSPFLQYQLSTIRSHCTEFMFRMFRELQLVAANEADGMAYPAHPRDKWDQILALWNTKRTCRGTTQNLYVYLVIIIMLSTLLLASGVE